MNELIQTVGANQTAGFILVLARISPLFVLAPIFSSRMIPGRARGVAAVALTIGMAPIAMADRKEPTEVFALAEHPRPCDRQDNAEREDLRDERQRHLLDLGDRLEDRDDKADDQADEHQRQPDLERDLDRVHRQGDDDVLVQGVPLPSLS